MFTMILENFLEDSGEYYQFNIVDYVLEGSVEYVYPRNVPKDCGNVKEDSGETSSFLCYGKG